MPWAWPWRRGDRRPGVIAWTTSGARARDLAFALDADVLVLATLGRRGVARTAAGYLLDAVRTLAWLARRRPAAIVVQNPPIIPGVLAVAWGRLTRTAVVLDSHTGSFGLKGDGVARRLLPLHRWLARRATAVLVAADALAAVVDGWGGRPLVLHEPEPADCLPARSTTRERPRVIYAGLLAPDEPIGAVLAAARLVPGVDVVLCGDPGARRALLEALAPPNVRLVGFLGPRAYRDAIAGADVVLALTTQPESTMRVACEAVWHRRPLVVSDSPAARTAFPSAVLVPTTAGGIAAGLERAVAALPALRAGVEPARAAQGVRVAAQLDELRAVLPRPAARLAP
jgi:hypothetical protein